MAYSDSSTDQLTNTKRRYSRFLYCGCNKIGVEGENFYGRDWDSDIVIVTKLG